MGFIQARDLLVVLIGLLVAVALPLVSLALVLGHHLGALAVFHVNCILQFLVPRLLVHGVGVIHRLYGGLVLVD